MVHINIYFSFYYSKTKFGWYLQCWSHSSRRTDAIFSAISCWALSPSAYNCDGTVIIIDCCAMMAIEVKKLKIQAPEVEKRE